MGCCREALPPDVPCWNRVPTLQSDAKAEARGKRGRTQRRGFWAQVKCSECPNFFERKVRPWKDKRPRMTCSPECYNARQDRLSKEWWKKNKWRKKGYDADYRRRHLVELREYDKRRANITLADCIICGAFFRKYRARVTCSPECTKERIKIYNRLQARRIRARRRDARSP